MRDKKQDTADRMEAQKKVRVLNHGTIENPRTMWKTNGYNDNEVTSGKSMTDPSAYVPTEEMIRRITRGERVPAGKYGLYEIQHKDPTLISPELADKLISDLSDPTDNPGFDLSDLPELQKAEAQIKARVKQLEKDKKEKARKEAIQKEAKKLADEEIRKQYPESQVGIPKDSELSNQSRKEPKKGSQDSLG